MKLTSNAVALALIVLTSSPAAAHFGMVIPSTNIVSQEEKNLTVTLSFSHPFENIGMELVKPKKFYSLHGGKETDLLETLTGTQVMNFPAWQTEIAIKRPGVLNFVMEPQPYWESAEDIYIIHYTKTAVAAFGDEEGWDQPANLPIEIVPLTRPFGNYSGNSFSGQVFIQGDPAPYSMVEVEYYNADKTYTNPTDLHITQVVKTDGQGIFHFTCNLPGWWGFSALTEASYTLPGPDGSQKTVEQGGVYWLRVDALQPQEKK